MRMLDSICKVIAEKYPGVPVYIEEVPEGFDRPSFFVNLATENTTLKNKNVYEDAPLYQVVYFGRVNDTRQVSATELYEVKEELKALFLLPGVFPVIPLDGVQEKQRYAHVTQYSSEVRLSETSLYTKLGASFTEHTQKPDEYPLIEDIDMEFKKN